jgi:hypothetical protein
MSEIYFSYAWKDREDESDGREKVVNDLYDLLKGKGHKVARDKNKVEYKDSIGGFMKNLGSSGFIITVISAKYLRSQYCMYEAIQILKKGNFTARVFPIVLDDSKIYEVREMANLMIYWQAKVKELKLLADQIEDDSTKIQLLNEKKDFEEIQRNIGDFITYIKDMKVLNDLVSIETRYHDIIESLEKSMALPNQSGVVPY